MVKKKIIIVMEGGIIQDISCIPEDVIIEVRDFDIDGIDPARLEQMHGCDCTIATWERRDDNATA